MKDLDEKVLRKMRHDVIGTAISHLRTAREMLKTVRAKRTMDLVSRALRSAKHLQDTQDDE